MPDLRSKKPTTLEASVAKMKSDHVTIDRPSVTRPNLDNTDVVGAWHELRRLHAAIRQFGRHQDGCHGDPEWSGPEGCTCGWKELEEKLRQDIPLDRSYPKMAGRWDWSNATFTAFFERHFMRS